MGPLGFSETLIWFTFIDGDGVMAPILSQIDDLPEYPDQQLLHNLMGIADGILRNVVGGSLAILRSRPGPGQMTDSDRAWALGLTTAAASCGVRMEPVHLATDEDLRVFAPDDLVVADSA